MPRGESQVPHARSGAAVSQSMKATGTPARNTVFHGKSSLWQTVSTGCRRLETPLTAGPREGRSGIVIRADQRSEMYERIITPDELGETTVEAAALIQNEAVASADLSLDVGQDLPPLVVKAQRTRRTNKSLAFKVPQQVKNRRRR